MSQASIEAPPQDTAPTEDRITLKGVADTALAPVRGFFGYFGDHSLLLFQSFMWLFRRPFRLKLFLEQMHFVGVGRAARHPPRAEPGHAGHGSARHHAVDAGQLRRIVARVAPVAYRDSPYRVC